MCHEPDSAPPELPRRLRLPRLAGAGGAESTQTVASDGTTVDIALAAVPDAAGPAVVILPDLHGLGPFYRTLTERFAAAGYTAAAFDYFGRQAPLPREEGFDGRAAVTELTFEEVLTDLLATIELVRVQTGAREVVIVGFCIGGTFAYLAGADPAVESAGIVAFYGGLSPEKFGFASPLDRAAEIQGPVLGLFGEADATIPAEQVSRLGAAFAGGGVPHEIHSYPDTPHAFFDRKAEEYAAASADAWERTLAFLAARREELGRR